MIHIEKYSVGRHRDTNHYYDKYLPYEFHLRMVVQVCEDFKELAMKEICKDNLHYFELIGACWAHDLIEDTRTNYNDLVKEVGKEIAEIVYALTNEKGRNRGERGSEKYYEGIRNTKGAIFVKLCDRIANVQYSKMTKSRMFEMYREENSGFVIKMGYYEGYLDNHPLHAMFIYLINLFI